MDVWPIGSIRTVFIVGVPTVVGEPGTHDVGVVLPLPSATSTPGAHKVLPYRPRVGLHSFESGSSNMSSGIDVLIRGAKVVDGSGNPWFYGDVALAGERIAAIAPPGSIPDRRPVRWWRRTAWSSAPASSIFRAIRSCRCMVDGRCLSKITQGVTTEIMGEAWTPAPLGGRNDGRSAPHALCAELERVAGAGHAAGRASATGLRRWSRRESRRMSARSWAVGRCASTVVAWRWVPSNVDELETMKPRDGRRDGGWRLWGGLCPDLSAGHLCRH